MPLSFSKQKNQSWEEALFSSPCTFYGKNGNLSRWKSCKTGCCRTCASAAGIGNLGTILLSLPLALLLGLKKEAIGACYSINRDSNLGLTTDIFGPDAPETRGTFAVYIVGSVIGTVLSVSWPVS